MKRLHLIGNAHIDPVWLWPWTEGLAETMATFRSALDRMQEFPEFTFTASSLALYAWVEQVDPAMFAEIQQRVAEGRWHIAGGWWLEPDCNIPCGEAFARQALYGQRFARQKFGLTARTGYNVDSFGHNGMLPQILKKSGCDTYVFMRPSPYEKDLPGRVFWWEAPDGSRVLTCRLPFQYGTWAPELDDHVQQCAAESQPPLEEMLCFYGVGDHGGGPTIANLNSLLRMSQQPGMPELIFSSLEAFFQAAEAVGPALPVVKGDLQHHSSGCYASHSGIKRWNRQAEQALLSAEKFAVLADWVGTQPYPAEFERAWKQLLFNQFHDILAGTSIEPAYDDARWQLGEAVSIAQRARALALQSLSGRIELANQPGVRPFVVFNPHPWAVKTPVALEPWQPVVSGKILDADGKVLPVQAVQGETSVTWCKRQVFLADLPPLGYQVYRLVDGESAGAYPLPPVGETLKAGGTCIENDWLRLEIDPVSGGIRSLFDKKSQEEVFHGLGARAVVIDDPSDTWSHDVLAFNTTAGEFTARRVALVESGPVCAVLRVVSGYAASTLSQDFCVYAGLPALTVRVTVDWHEQQKMLKLAFPLALQAPRPTYAIPFGSIERPPDGLEEAGQEWVDVSGEGADGKVRGLSLLNDGKYSFSVNGNVLNLTVLRSPIYAHHIPYVPEAGLDYRYIDQGEQRFTYQLMPHAGRWQEAGVVRQALLLNQPCIPVQASFHAGAYPQKASFIAVEPENIAVSAVQRAEDGDDLVIRLYETAGLATVAMLKLPVWNRTWQGEISPYEVKTLRIPRDGAQEIRETNLLED